MLLLFVVYHTSCTHTCSCTYFIFCLLSVIPTPFPFGPPLYVFSFRLSSLAIYIICVMCMSCLDTLLQPPPPSSFFFKP
ncbi:hypothetical protein F4810DRAFT_655607 [Camillea tinctor]|nr:hypothetical protein F4810DRAFT_655607 [Camillea tinctor]